MYDDEGVILRPFSRLLVGALESLDDDLKIRWTFLMVSLEKTGKHLSCVRNEGLRPSKDRST